MMNPTERAQAAVASRQFDLVAGILDGAELEISNPTVLHEWPYALHLLGHIYNKQLIDARFLWKRIPAAVKQALEGHAWSPAVEPYIRAVAVKTRAELLELLATAYSSVKPAKVASICGLPEAEALKVPVKVAAAEPLEVTGDLQLLAEYMANLEQP
ncbi:CSN8_PSD8_EIF3K domain-containing protein [Haematococcus lacustris]|uniref:CSN8_PSD8_EIF3K domain-containing protein n=1 Tax=Haematococcus lacustris TaxID=44745 RepID=A0A699YGM5_HAELA|nr:CSN8_PSD8_EIF3K domain-containing protein [Haematococcus lacustris]